MNKDEIADIIRNIVDDIQENPSQFNFDVQISSVGFQASNTGGIGYMVSPVANAPVGTMIGMQANGPSDVDITIAQRRATDEINIQMTEALNSLTILADELTKNKPNKSILQSTVDALASSIILPTVVANTVILLVRKYLGI